MIYLFLTSGLFLGWSLGANNAANVFGTAVGSKMIRLKTAAMVCGVFVIIGAVYGGAGPANTLVSLGSVNAIAGAFMIALSAALTVFWMTKVGVPVSTSQAIVGGIIGWNFYSDIATNYSVVAKIVIAWIVCPVLSALFGILLFIVLRSYLQKAQIHLFRIDMYLRIGLLLAGAFGSYSLGANNIANVMGVFIPVSPFQDLNIPGWFSITGSQQLFFIGGLAIAVGVYTYSSRVMKTVGRALLKISPMAALVVVLSQGLVLYLFSSEHLAGWMNSIGLPSIPLVPLSSSQAVVGAIIGIGIVKGGRGIRYKVLGGIAAGWVLTPLITCIITFVGLFFLQNVFKQEVNRQVSNSPTPVISQSLRCCDTEDDSINRITAEASGNPHKFVSLMETAAD